MSGWLLPLEIPVQIGRDEARQRALDELAKAKYGGTPEWVSDLASQADRLIQRLVDLWLGLSRVRQSSGGGINWGFVLAVVVLLVAIGLIVWRVGLPRWKRRTAGASLQLDSSVPASNYRGLAAQFAEQGDWTAAVRDRFRAMVRELEVRTILDVRPARTATEAAYSASKVLPDCRDVLRVGAESFNAVVYGERPADSAAYQRMVELDDRVTRAADRVDLAADSAPAEARR